ncbi:MAG: Stp1/IreP family PP2C-type Ser/Thr phosphatase [Polyangiaceae bacterium]|jgi:protein phosphatase|nr:Stp1/IreP family PP2C-type Ser/Thr phosphatase [Polyangiaceae bacterium]
MNGGPSPASSESNPDEQVEGGPIQLRLFGRTDVGQVREHNEDNFLVADLSRKSRGLLEADRVQTLGERGALMAVCDGMGGAAAGEIASQLAVDIIFERMSEGEAPTDRNEFARRIVRAIEDAGLRIYNEAKADRTRRGMGTTSTVAALVDNHLFLGQVGDSRGYILRQGKLVQVTRDQSLVNQLIEAGQLTEEEAETFEHNNIILQALGTSDSVQVDLTFVELRRGDVLLLCSDGLSGMVRAEELRDTLQNSPEPLDACKLLTEKANQAGGHDNITCIVARFDGPGLKAVSSEDPELKYRKYILPSEPGGQASVQEGSAGTSGDRNGSAAQRGRPNSQVNVTLVGNLGDILGNLSPEQRQAFSGTGASGASGAHNASIDEHVELPINRPPAWVVVIALLCAIAVVGAAAIFLLN